MRIEALICPRCGAPLPRPAALPTIVECAYCGSALSLTSSEANVTREASADEARDTARRQQRVSFSEALAAALSAGRDPYDALHEAAAAHLANVSDPETLARVAYALASDFEREADVSIRKDPNVLVRIAEAYMRTFAELRTAPETTINLPFLTMNDRGPVHYQRTVTPAILASLAARDPHAPAPKPVATPSAFAAAPVAAAPTEPPRKKRGWWPF